MWTKLEIINLDLKWIILTNQICHEDIVQSHFRQCKAVITIGIRVESRIHSIISHYGDLYCMRGLGLASGASSKRTHDGRGSGAVLTSLHAVVRL